jgi:hypothetical protein
VSHLQKRLEINEINTNNIDKTRYLDPQWDELELDKLHIIYEGDRL